MITKIKFEGPFKAHTQIVTTENNGALTDTKKITKSEEPRHLDFTRAMANILAPAAEILPIEDRYVIEHGEVIGVSLGHKESTGISAIITLLLDVPNCHAPLLINTPRMTEIGDDTGMDQLPFQLVDALADLMRQAEKFLAGHTAQERLPFDEPELQAADEFHENLRASGMRVVPSDEENTIRIEPVS